MGALFTNVEPEPDAAGRRGPDRITVDVTTSSGPDPVVSASIAISVDGVPLTVSTVSIFGGYRATAPYRFNDEQTYTVDIEAETVATVGSPATLSYTFTTATWVTALMVASGTPGSPYGLATLVGAVPRVLDGFLAISGNILSVLDQYLRLDGGVSPQPDLLRLGEALILDGWVTVYITEHLLFAAIQVGEPAADPFPAAIDVYEEAAAQQGLVVAIGVYSVGEHPALLAAINNTQPIAQRFDAAIQAGEATAQPVPAALGVEGYAASALLVIDSPSDAWRDDDESEG